jgi:membrane protease subunit (stomatin/prohibitin family)
MENAMKMLKAVAVLALSAASLSAVAMTNADRYGEAASPAAADRTIVISPNTRFVNVNHGEVVKFVANGQEFAWDFDGLPQAFDLKQVAPQGALAQNVKVYIEATDQDISIGD